MKSVGFPGGLVAVTFLAVMASGCLQTEADPGGVHVPELPASAVATYQGPNGSVVQARLFSAQVLGLYGDFGKGMVLELPGVGEASRFAADACHRTLWGEEGVTDFSWRAAMAPPMFALAGMTIPRDDVVTVPVGDGTYGIGATALDEKTIKSWGGPMSDTGYLLQEWHQWRVTMGTGWFPEVIEAKDPYGEYTKWTRTGLSETEGSMFAGVEQACSQAAPAYTMIPLSPLEIHEDPPLPVSLRQTMDQVRSDPGLPETHAFFAAHEDAYLKTWGFGPSFPSLPWNQGVWVLSFAYPGGLQEMHVLCRGGMEDLLPLDCSEDSYTVEEDKGGHAAPDPDWAHLKIVSYADMAATSQAIIGSPPNGLDYGFKDDGVYGQFEVITTDRPVSPTAHSITSVIYDAVSGQLTRTVGVEPVRGID